MKAAERIEAERLRQDRGLSVRSIAEAVGVSPGTASRWLRDVPLTQAQRAVLESTDPVRNGRCLGARRLEERARASRLEAQRDGRGVAARGDPLHHAGCMLYWAEGTKARNRVVFTNSDEVMVATFLRFLRSSYEIADESVRLSVNVHLGNGLSLDQVEGWWCERLQLPPSCLRQAAVNRVSRASKRKRGPLVYGTARLVVNSTFIVQSIYGGIQAYSGFDRPEWLD